MKWKTKKYIPEEGHLRTVRKFAFLPTTCGPYTVWLETYESEQKYTKVVEFCESVPGPILEWVEYKRNYLELYP
jgi:hypothetical protein